MASDALSALKMQVFENKALDSVCTSQQVEEVDCINHKLFDEVCNLGQGLDCISQLPDDLVINIVSRLTFKEAIRTSVLASRWIDLWKSAVSVLDFDASEELLALYKFRAGLKELPERRRRYMNGVNRVVNQMQQSCSRVTKFRVLFHLPRECNSEGDIDRWLNFAISNRVESLHLIFNLNRFLFLKNYVFPKELYNHIKTPAGMHDIGFLRSLHLSSVDVKCEILEHFIANCPLLEELAVKRCFCSKKLKVVGSSHAPLRLKHLEVIFCKLLESVEINHTPHLERLIYEDIIHGKEIQVGESPSLVDVTLGRRCVKHQTFRALSGCASQLVTLSLTLYGMWELFSDVAEHSKLERLIVHVEANDTDSILRVIPLINACPRLHTLQLFFRTEYTQRRTRPLVRVVKERRDSIKVVEVVGFRGYDIDCEFMEYVIEYFGGLEKIVIDWATTSLVDLKAIPPCSEEQLREAEKRALDLKSRASPMVEFLVI